MSGCKVDELRRRLDEDEDDDPSAHKDSELPRSSPSRLGMQAKTQGESVQPAEGAGKGPMEADDSIIEALQDIDELTFYSDLSDKEEGLEEGEILPLVIEDWKSYNEVLPDVDEDINEHVVPNQSKTEVVFERASATLIDLDEIKSSMNEEDEEIAVNEPAREKLRSLWFRK